MSIFSHTCPAESLFIHFLPHHNPFSVMCADLVCNRCNRIIILELNPNSIVGGTNFLYTVLGISEISLALLGLSRFDTSRMTKEPLFPFDKHLDCFVLEP